MVKVHLNGKDYEIDPKSDEPLMKQLKKQGVPVVAACGGAGICQTCGIRLKSGELTEKTATEEMMDLPEGERLSCQCKPVTDCDIELIY
jgi:ferredoxin